MTVTAVELGEEKAENCKFWMKRRRTKEIAREKRQSKNPLAHAHHSHVMDTVTWLVLMDQEGEHEENPVRHWTRVGNIVPSLSHLTAGDPLLLLVGFFPSISALLPSETNSLKLYSPLRTVHSPSPLVFGLLYGSLSGWLIVSNCTVV